MVPFTAEEVLILRTLIEDWEYDQRRKKFWRGAWGMTAKAVGLLGGVAVVADSLKGLLG